MTGRQRRRAEMVINANIFFGERADDFKTNAVAVEKISALAALVPSIQQSRESQLSSGGSVGENYDRADDIKDELKNQMQAIADFARAIGRRQSGFEERFRMPRNNGSRNLLTAARVFAADGLEFKDQFVAYGMDADFLDVLNQKITRLEQSLKDAETAMEDRTGATGELSVKIKNAVELVRELDPIVRYRYRNDPAALAAWTHASHIERDPRASGNTPNQ